MNNKASKTLALVLALQMASSTVSPAMAQVKLSESTNMQVNMSSTVNNKKKILNLIKKLKEIVGENKTSFETEYREFEIQVNNIEQSINLFGIVDADQAEGMIDSLKDAFDEFKALEGVNISKTFEEIKKEVFMENEDEDATNKKEEDSSSGNDLEENITEKIGTAMVDGSNDYFDSYNIDVKVKFYGNKIVSVNDNNTNPDAQVSKNIWNSFVRKNGLSIFNDKTIEELKNLVIDRNSIDGISGATRSAEALKKAVLNAYGINDTEETKPNKDEDTSSKKTLIYGETLTLKSYDKDLGAYIFESTLPKDYEVKLESVKYGIDESEEIQGAVLEKKDETTYALKVSSVEKPGVYYLNIVDAKGKYNSPEKKLKSVKGKSSLSWRDEIINNKPSFEVYGFNKTDFHNGRIIGEDLENIQRLNKNIKKIVCTTLGYGELQTYYPDIENLDNNTFYNNDGSINQNYIIGSAKDNSRYSENTLIRNLQNMQEVKWIFVFYYGTNNFTTITYTVDEGFQRVIVEDNPAIIEASGYVPGKALRLKIKLNFEENLVEELMDNNTEESGNPAYTNYMINGFGQYKGKTLDEIRKIVIEEGQDTQARETAMIAREVKDTVIKALEANNSKLSSYSKEKRNLKILLNESYATKIEIKDGAFKSEGTKEFENEYDKAINIFKDKSKTDEDFRLAYNSLKSSKDRLERKDKDNTLLKQAIEEARKYRADDYEEWSYEFLTKAIDETEKELDKHLNPTEIQKIVEKIKKIESNLVPRIQGQRKYYKIQGKINEDGKSSESMANNALGEIYIEEVNGKTIYHLLFKPMIMMGVTAEIQNLKHFEDDKFKQTTVRISKNNPYTKVITFVRDRQREDGFKIQTGAYMLGKDISYRNADFKIGSQTREEISGETLKNTLKAETPNLGITNDKKEVPKSDNENNVNVEDTLIEGVDYKIPFEWKRDSSEEDAMGKEAFESIIAKIEGQEAIITIKTKELEIKNSKATIKGHLLNLFIKDSKSKSTNENDRSKALKGEIEAEKSNFKNIENSDSNVKEYPTTFTFKISKDVLNKKQEVNVRVIVDVMDQLSGGEAGSGKGSKPARFIFNPKGETLKPIGKNNSEETKPINPSLELDELRKEYYKCYALSERDYDIASWNIFKEKYNKVVDILIGDKKVSQAEVEIAKKELIDARNQLKRIGNTSTENSVNNQKAYSMIVTALEENRDKTSMAEAAIVNPVIVKKEGDKLYAQVKMRSVNLRGLDGEVQKIYSFSGNNKNGRKIAAIKNGNIFTFEVPREVLDRHTEVYLEVNVDVMDELAGGGYESGNRIFRMIFDPNNKNEVNIDLSTNNNTSKIELEREIRDGLNYNSRDYDYNSWRDFQYALDRGREILSNNRASNSEINRALDDLVRAKRNLLKNSTTKPIESKNTLEDKKVDANVKTYEVSVDALRADGRGASMAREAVHRIARVEEKDGKFKYYVSFRPIEKSFKGKTLRGSITKLFYYDGGKYEAKDEGSGVWSFTLNSKVEDVKIAVWVDAMDELKGGIPGAGEQDAILRFNWSSSKDITPKKEENKVTNNVIFYDIQNHWARIAIEYGFSKGYFEGVGNNTFAPNRGMTRGEFVTVLGRMQHIDTSKYQNSKFSDVNSKAFYATYVNWATEKGIVNGIGNGKFSPNDIITREQMAVMMSKYLKITGKTLQGTGNVIFKDSSKISNWAKDSVMELARANVINGMEDGTFSPKTALTRAQVAQIIYNVDHK